MVTPENGTVTFTGRSGKTYTYSIYSSDVVAAPVTWATTGLAGTGSTNFITAPEDMLLSDVSLTTGQTVAVGWSIWLNDAPYPSAVMTFANVLNTLQTRSFPKGFGIKQGRKVQLVQF